MLKDEYSGSSASASNSKENKPRIYLWIPERIKDIYESYSQRDDFSKFSQALTYGVMSYLEGSLSLIRDEKTTVEEIFGHIVDKEDLKCNFKKDLYLEKTLLDKLLQKFNVRVHEEQEDEKIIALAIRLILYKIMHAQILKWKEKSNPTQKKAVIKDPDIKKGEKRLNEILNKLKNQHNYGDKLVVEWLPKPYHELAELGKVENNRMYIYYNGIDYAEWLVCHEFAEYMIKTVFTKPYLDLVNLELRKRLTEAYWKQEKMVDQFADMMFKQATGKERPSVPESSEKEER